MTFRYPGFVRRLPRPLRQIARQGIRLVRVVRGGGTAAVRVLGRVLLRGHLPGAAERIFLLAARLDRNPWSEVWAARAATGNGAAERAIGAYRRALERRPTMLVAARERAFLLRQRGDLASATATLLAVGLASDDSAHRCAVAETMVDSGAASEAAQLVEDVLAREPDDEMALSVRDRAHLVAGTRSTESLTELAAGMLERPDPAQAAAAANYLLRTVGAERTLQLHRKAGSPELTVSAARRLCEELYRTGRVRAALEVAESAGESSPSPWLADFVSRRRRDVELLEGRFALHPRHPTPVGTPRISATYLLHNSLPYQSGGYATRTHGLLSAVNRHHGHEVIGVTRPGFPPENGFFDQRRGIPAVDVVDGVAYHRLISSSQVLPRADIDRFTHHYSDLLRPILTAHRPGIVHAASNWWNGLGGWMAAKEADLPFVYEVRGLWELTRGSREPEWYGSEGYDVDARLEAEAAARGDHVFVLTGALLEEMAQRGVPRDRLSVLPNAVDTGRFEMAGPDPELQRRYGLEGVRVLGFAGSITFYEGLDDLMRAAAALRGRTREPFRLVIVGDGAYADALRALAGELLVDDLVTFTGRVPHGEIDRYLSLFDITPFPRKPLPVCEMVSPLKPLESMAAGAAVLVSDVSALAEMVHDGVTGRCVPKGDVDALADGLAELIDDVDRCAELTANAREWVTAHRSWEVVSRDMAAVYDGLLGRDPVTVPGVGGGADRAG